MQQCKSNPFGFLSGNILKIFACIFMAIDHVGVVFYPRVALFRIIGRLALPIFAFMIAEGCKYTKNRLRYFLTIFISGALFQVVYLIAERSLMMGIFITFSFSILLIYALDFFKESVIDQKSTKTIVLSGILFLTSVIAVYFLCKKLSVDYGFWGIMLPVFASVFNFRKRDSEVSINLSKKNFIWLNIFTLTIGLIILASVKNSIQFYALLAIPLLLLYSGKRGMLKMKYFYYAFYPAHLVIIYAVDIVLKMI